MPRPGRGAQQYGDGDERGASVQSQAARRRHDDEPSGRCLCHGASTAASASTRTHYDFIWIFDQKGLPVRASPSSPGRDGVACNASTGTLHALT